MDFLLFEAGCKPEFHGEAIEASKAGTTVGLGGLGAEGELARVDVFGGDGGVASVLDEAPERGFALLVADGTSELNGGGVDGVHTETAREVEVVVGGTVALALHGPVDLGDKVRALDGEGHDALALGGEVELLVHGDNEIVRGKAEAVTLRGLEVDVDGVEGDTKISLSQLRVGAGLHDADLGTRADNHLAEGCELDVVLNRRVDTTDDGKRLGGGAGVPQGDLLVENALLHGVGDEGLAGVCVANHLVVAHALGSGHLSLGPLKDVGASEGVQRLGATHHSDARGSGGRVHVTVVGEGLGLVTLLNHSRGDLGRLSAARDTTIVGDVGVDAGLEVTGTKAGEVGAVRVATGATLISDVGELGGGGARCLALNTTAHVTQVGLPHKIRELAEADNAGLTVAGVLNGVRKSLKGELGVRNPAVTEVSVTRVLVKGKVNANHVPGLGHGGIGCRGEVLDGRVGHDGWMCGRDKEFNSVECLCFPVSHSSTIHQK